MPRSRGRDHWRDHRHSCSSRCRHRARGRRGDYQCDGSVPRQSDQGRSNRLRYHAKIITHTHTMYSFFLSHVATRTYIPADTQPTAFSSHDGQRSDCPPVTLRVRPPVHESQSDIVSHVGHTQTLPHGRTALCRAAARNRHSRLFELTELGSQADVTLQPLRSRPEVALRPLPESACRCRRTLATSRLCRNAGASEAMVAGVCRHGCSPTHDATGVASRNTRRPRASMKPESSLDSPTRAAIRVTERSAPVACP